MLIICVTHPITRKVGLGFFRVLGRDGRSHAKAAGRRLMRVLKPLLKDRKIEYIEAVASSPAARCIHTAVVVADQLRGITRVNHIVVDENLTEQQASGKAVPISGKHITQVLKNLGWPQAVLLSMHADLARVLPHGLIKAKEIDEGWFKARPVIAVLECTQSKPWTQAKLLLCERLGDGKWVKISNSMRQR